MSKIKAIFSFQKLIFFIHGLKKLRFTEKHIFCRNQFSNQKSKYKFIREEYTGYGRLLGSTPSALICSVGNLANHLRKFVSPGRASLIPIKPFFAIISILFLKKNTITLTHEIPFIHLFQNTKNCVTQFAVIHKPMP